MLRLFQKLRRYPPKITLDFVEGRAASTCKVEINFSGAAASRPLKDSIRLHPRESKQNVKFLICPIPITWLH